MARTVLRPLTAFLAAAASGWLLWWCAGPRLRAVAALIGLSSESPRWTLADIVAASVAITAVGAYAILLATAAVAIGSHVVAPHRAERIAAGGWAGPRWWRTLVLTACGLGVAAQAATAAAAPDLPPCVSACAPSLDGLPYPDLPSQTWPRAHEPPHRPPRAAAPAPAGWEVRPAHLIVRPGDCLWTIAADRSPPRASDAAIAALADRLYAANREVIGDDPDLIYPGTALKAPGGSP